MSQTQTTYIVGLNPDIDALQSALGTQDIKKAWFDKAVLVEVPSHKAQDVMRYFEGQARTFDDRTQAEEEAKRLQNQGKGGSRS